MCFARLVLRVRLFMASHVEPGRDLPPILYRFVDNGKLVSYVHYEEEFDRRSAAKLLTHDEARRFRASRQLIR